MKIKALFIIVNNLGISFEVIRGILMIFIIIYIEETRESQINKLMIGFKMLN